MTDTFTSVTLLFAAIRQTLLDAGMTIERTLGVRDIIVTGAGCLARVQHVVVSPSVSAIGIELGVNADSLETVPKDPETCFPFDTTSGGSVNAQLDWNPDTKRLYVHMLTPGRLTGYRAEFDFAACRATVAHEDPPNMLYSPDFHASGGPYHAMGT